MIQKKWDKIYQECDGEANVAEVLQNNHYLLPSDGVALDLACGLGGNALFLADKGLKVRAWDISPVAIKKLEAMATANGLELEAAVRDVVAEPPEVNSVDVLVVSGFLDRGLCPALFAAINPGGLLLYQTYCVHKVDKRGPSNPDYLLADNELLSLFPKMMMRVYREEALLGNHAWGMRNQAWLLAEKPG